MKILITIPDEKYNYIKELERGNTDYATTLMLYHAVKYGKPYINDQIVTPTVELKNDTIHQN